MWKYIKQYLFFAVIAGCFMVGEVSMDLLQPSIMSRVVDEGVLGTTNGGVGNMHLILVLGIRMILLVLFGGFCGSMNNVFVHYSTQNMGNEMRKDAFSKIMKFSFSQSDKYGAGTLVTRVTNDITQIQNYIGMFIRGLIRTGLTMFGSLFFLFRLNLTFGLTALVAFPFVIAIMGYCLYRGNPMFTVLQSKLDAVNSIMQEDVSGIRVIKACVREVYERARFGKVNSELTDTQLRVLLIFALMNPTVTALMYLVVAGILVIGHFRISYGIITPGIIMAAITYTTQLLNSIMNSTMLFQSISRGTASWKRVKEILGTEPEQKNGTFSGETDEKGCVEFRDVGFKYPGGTQTVLEHVDFKINRGETVAIMGTTGCGKTSLVRLIPRFYDATAGQVLVDGVDVCDYDEIALRQKVGIVLQKSELFSASIADNIRWGNPQADDAAVEVAAKIAQADDFIQSTPDGYQTFVAERGMSLSGGQKQRISIARAVLKAPEILIFDDSTSALDLKTEANFYSALHDALPDTTKIIVAQRIASVRNADRIMVLEDGHIVAVGSHSELMKNCPSYQEIYYSQLGKEEEAYA
ncbi:MAG: ABC transporter ATP-binding protein/permease [Clostridiales bacterium]|nr:ABC transporter ATP-binding protein/permease [Clostridiales bacterium]